MRKNLRKELLSWGGIAVLVLFLWITGWYIPVIGFLQRGIVETGLMQPNIEQTKTAKPTENSDAANLNFRLINTEGEIVNLKEFHGKVIFLNIWATWCMPCRAEMPNINKLYNDLKDENIEFVMLSVDRDFSKARNYVHKENFDFNIYAEAGIRPEMFKSQTLPTTYIIDAKGNLVLTHLGMADYNTEDFKTFLREHM